MEEGWVELDAVFWNKFGTALPPSEVLLVENMLEDDDEDVLNIEAAALLAFAVLLPPNRDVVGVVEESDDAEAGTDCCWNENGLLLLLAELDCEKGLFKVGAFEEVFVPKRPPPPELLSG